MLIPLRVGHNHFEARVSTRVGVCVAAKCWSYGATRCVDCHALRTFSEIHENSVRWENVTSPWVGDTRVAACSNSTGTTGTIRAACTWGTTRSRGTAGTWGTARTWVLVGDAALGAAIVHFAIQHVQGRTGGNSNVAHLGYRFCWVGLRQVHPVLDLGLTRTVLSLKAFGAPFRIRAHVVGSTVTHCYPKCG